MKEKINIYDYEKNKNLSKSSLQFELLEYTVIKSLKFLSDMNR